jgi:signal peptidase II
MQRTKWLTFLLIVAFILLLDQVSKAWVLQNIEAGQTLLLIPQLHPYFQLTYSQNTGAAFGIFPAAGGVLLVVAILVSCVVVWFFIQSEARAHLQHTGMALVVGGAMGNVIDRLQHGFVVDFVHLSLPGVISNVSNFADHAIVLGVLALLLDSWKRDRAARAAPPAQQNPAAD